MPGIDRSAAPRYNVPGRIHAGLGFSRDKPEGVNHGRRRWHLRSRGLKESSGENG